MYKKYSFVKICKYDSINTDYCHSNFSYQYFSNISDTIRSLFPCAASIMHLKI